jgi:hypothetical protein
MQASPYGSGTDYKSAPAAITNLRQQRCADSPVETLHATSLQNPVRALPSSFHRPAVTVLFLLYRMACPRERLTSLILASLIFNSIRAVAALFVVQS